MLSTTTTLTFTTDPRPYGPEDEGAKISRSDLLSWARAIIAANEPAS